VDNSREVAALERALVKHAERRERAQDARIDGALTKEDFARQLARIEAATEPVRRKLERLRAEQRSAEEMSAGAESARTLLETLRKKDYNFQEKRRIVQSLVQSVIVGPLEDAGAYYEGRSRTDSCQIDFRFCYKPRMLWPRGTLPKHSVTEEEAQAGAAGLLIASGATP
jgi:hypothetical protein